MDQDTDYQSENSNKPWQFQPGQSGNPQGRPKGSVSLVAAIIAKLKEADPEMPSRTRNEKVAEAAVAKAEAGDTAMLKELLDRVDGKVTDKLEVTSGDVPTAEKIARIKAKVKESEKQALKN